MAFLEIIGNPPPIIRRAIISNPTYKRFVCMSRIEPIKRVLQQVGVAEKPVCLLQSLLKAFLKVRSELSS